MWTSRELEESVILLLRDEFENDFEGPHEESTSDKEFAGNNSTPGGGCWARANYISVAKSNRLTLQVCLTQ